MSYFRKCFSVGETGKMFCTCRHTVLDSSCTAGLLIAKHTCFQDWDWGLKEILSEISIGNELHEIFLLCHTLGKAWYVNKWVHYYYEILEIVGNAGQLRWQTCLCVPTASCSLLHNKSNDLSKKYVILFLFTSSFLPLFL